MKFLYLLRWKEKTVAVHYNKSYHDKHHANKIPHGTEVDRQPLCKAKGQQSFGDFRRKKQIEFVDFCVPRTKPNEDSLSKWNSKSRKERRERGFWKNMRQKVV